MLFQRLKKTQEVLDIACDNCYVGNYLINEKKCDVTGIDQIVPDESKGLNSFFICDLDKEEIPVNLSKFQYILMLDVIEHLKNPEVFMEILYKKINNSDCKVILSRPMLPNFTGSCFFWSIQLWSIWYIG